MEISPLMTIVALMMAALPLVSRDRKKQQIRLGADASWSNAVWFWWWYPGPCWLNLKKVTFVYSVLIWKRMSTRKCMAWRENTLSTVLMSWYKNQELVHIHLGCCCNYPLEWLAKEFSTSLKIMQDNAHEP